MDHRLWIQEFPAAITICDTNGMILDMNEKATQTFNKSGGKDLIGRNLFDCHPESAREKIKELMESKKTNAYTIEKNSVKKLIFQSPWYENGVLGGLVEISMEIPMQMPHFIRKNV